MVETGEKTFINNVLVSRLFKARLKDVNVLRGTVGGMSDHY